jgi:BA14K-like protein
MSRLATAALAALFGFAAISTSTTTASADWKGPPQGYHNQSHGNGGWKPGPGVGFAAGALVGLGVGAIVATPRPYYPPVRPYYPPVRAYYPPVRAYYYPPPPVYYPPPPVVYRAPPPPVYYYPATAWNQAHVDWCNATYRSYNPATDAFIGYDGYPHRCVAPY